MSAFVQSQSPVAGANAPLAATAASAIEFELDGRPVQASCDETIWQVARRVGIEIPHLCHREGLPPVGNCRACVVEVASVAVVSAFALAAGGWDWTKALMAAPRAERNAVPNRRDWARPGPGHRTRRRA